MNLRPLGATRLCVSPIGFGCWQLGGEGWGKSSARESTAAARRALDLGVRLFDTAPVYGFGRSEELLGKALRDAPDDVVVISKGGLVWDERRRVAHDNRPASLRTQLEGTLRRLGREAVDVYLLHWPDPAVSLEESAPELQSLRAAGKIRAWGVSNFPAADALAFASDGIVLEYPLNCLGEYASEHRAPAAAGAELLELARPESFGFVAFDALARGLLAGRHDESTVFGKRDVRSRDARYAGEARARSFARARHLRALAAGLGVSPAALALRAVLERTGVTACLAGMKSPAQVEENATAASLELSDATLAALAALRAP